MRNIIVEHGPPGARGVSQIMGLADLDEVAPGDERLAQATRRAGLVAGAALLFGLVTGSKAAVNVSLGLGVGAVLVHRWGQ